MREREGESFGKAIATCHVYATEFGQEVDYLVHIYKNDTDELALKVCNALSRRKSSFTFNGKYYRIGLSQVFNPKALVNMGSSELYRVKNEQKSVQAVKEDLAPVQLSPIEKTVQVSISCPVHTSTLKQADISYMRTWFCAECGVYYILPVATKVCPSSIQGKPVKILDFKYQAIVDRLEKEIKAQIEDDLRLRANIEQLKKKYKPVAVFKRPFYTQPLLKGNDSVCPFCNEPLNKKAIVQIMIYKDKRVHHKILRVLPCCKKCHAPFLPEETYQLLLKKLRSQTQMLYVFNPKLCHNKEELLKVAQFISNDRNEQVPPIPDPPKYPFDLPSDYQTILPNLSLLQPGKYIWLYSKKCHCYMCLNKYKTDTIRNRTALVQTLSGTTVKINVEYCIGCGEYYMNAASLRAYNKKYGAILAEFSFHQFDRGLGWDSFDGFNPDSVLSRCGYNARVGTPKEYRQAIISFVLDSGKAKKWELLELLKSFINVHQYSHPDACDRWQEDILFVNDYKIQTQEVVSDLSLKHGK